ncbi:glycosyltransferase family 4 protein [Paraburkholderia sp. D1E]|uniref:glycosyltransferase family 4 protein n=1 Tax=Paraburkholderia sp. D1E TaxID=3461398 RepID=UPI004045A010
MKVMLDGYNLRLEKGTGVATYARNLSYCARSLGYQVNVLYGNSSSGKTSPLMREINFFDPLTSKSGPISKFLREARDVALSPRGYDAHAVPITGAVVSEGFTSRLPYFDNIWNVRDLFRRAHDSYSYWKKIFPVRMPETPDIMHWTYPLPIKIKGAKNIYTLHDLVPLRLPYTTLDNKKRYLNLCKTLAREADHIVTVSETSRTDIINMLGVAPEKVTNTYQSVHVHEKFANKPADVIKRELEGAFGLSFKNYFLYYGAIEPKKNVGRLIEAYCGSGIDTPLVIVGAKAWKADQELRFFSDNQNLQVDKSYETSSRTKILRIDYVPFSLLISLIKGAKATLFPSLYEGFGLPVLESMLLGTPVLSSNLSSIPEVAGKAAILVNPYDTHEIAEAIRALDVDDMLRQRLSNEGTLRASLFSDSAHQKKLSNLYESLLHGNR